MKKILSIILLTGFLFFSIEALYSQVNAKPTTYILFRHAEKDTGNNPPLTAAGVKRSKKLPTLFNKIKPTDFYSTPFIRTKQTITPWANKVHKPIQEYNQNNLPEFAEILKNKKGEIVVIAGHSNTTPALVNLLIGSQKYPQMDDADFGKIYIVTIDNNKIEDKVINY